ncbi:hypothetical protein [Mesorhizobium sp. B2-3-4]|uniref:hypothetical protein n=1 Tax=Mesorhizobium sp. B2-3-4 TaxID=2589959 RepID=UPI001129FB26|nr:hypothetical protein [Mesorhizobium sp. B2-3-4]TPM25698.1 hypothetical protein FJ967_32240 [Mesorhizobium sp. B2-3-4]
MEAKDFNAWIAHMGWNDSEVARQLDISRNTVATYKVKGAPVSIGYACASLAFGLPAWAEPSRSDPAYQDWLQVEATTRAQMRAKVLQQMNTLAKVVGVCTEDLQPTLISDRPLREAIRLVAEGIEGHLTSGARVMFGQDGSLDHAQCKDMLKHHGDEL